MSLWSTEALTTVPLPVAQLAQRKGQILKLTADTDRPWNPKGQETEDEDRGTWSFSPIPEHGHDPETPLQPHSARPFCVTGVGAVTMVPPVTKTPSGV